VEPKLIPNAPNWIVPLLQTKPKSFFLVVYDGSGFGECKGCIIADDIKPLRLYYPRYSYRTLRYLSLSDEPYECVFCHRTHYSGWTFQQELEAFICNSCFLGN